MKKDKRITAHVADTTKEEIKKIAEKEDRSESYIAGKILDEAINGKHKTIIK